MLTRLEGAPIGVSLQLSDVLAELPFDQLDGACHTGRRNCFYNAVRSEHVEVISASIPLPIDQNKK